MIHPLAGLVDLTAVPDTRSDQLLARLAHLQELETAHRGGGEDASGSPTIHYPSPLQEDWRSLFGQLKGVRFSNGAGDTVRVTSAGDTVAAETDDRGKTDKERLQEKVKTYGLVERQVAGDGNCQFRVLSDQLFGTDDQHSFVRSMVVERLRQCSEEYRPYVSGTEYKYYVDAMAQDGTWGDHITLQAFADAFGAHLSIITSYEDSCVIEIAPSTPVNHRRPLWLSFWAEVHYNSLHLPHGETPHGTGDLGSSDAARIRQTKLARGLVRRCFGGLCYAVPQAVR